MSVSASSTGTRGTLPDIIFDIPPQQFGEKRPWSPWADLSQDTVSLSAVISDALVENAERILFVPTVQLRWAYCDPATNLWSQYSTPERLVATTYALISARVPYITDALSAFTHALQSIGDALDDPAAHGFSPADIPVLQADRITLTALTKRLQTILKHVEAHTMGGRILATEITAQISARLQAAPDFNFRTVHIEGLPFLNGMLRSATRTTRRDPEDPDSTTLLPDVRLTPYAPSDRVEATRPIQRHFDLDRVHGRNVARTYLLDGQAPAAPGNGPYDDGADAEAAPRLPLLRPHGWDWLVGLPGPGPLRRAAALLPPAELPAPGRRDRDRRPGLADVARLVHRRRLHRPADRPDVPV